MNKMSKIKIGSISKSVSFASGSNQVEVWRHGSIDIALFNVPKEALENIAKITGKEIKERGTSRWINFPKARDGSRVTLFED